MKHKIIAISLALVLLGAGSGFALEQYDLENLQRKVDAFSTTMAETLPFNSTLGLSWADAYIGNFPHFGVGIFGGLSFMDKSAVEDLLSDFNLSLPSSLNFMPLPAAGAEARLGGFFLPFDIGFKFGMLPAMNFSDDISLDYMMIGGDIRYAILKGNVILPKITIGVGYNYIRGNINSKVGTGIEYDISDNGNNYSIKVDDPEVNLTWSSNVIDFKLQVSKTFFFITPYAGLGYSYGWAKSGYDVSAPTTVTGGSADEINAILASRGLPSVDVGDNGFSSIIKAGGWDLRFFGGLAFNIAVVKIDLTGMYDFNNSIWNAGLGIRFQM